jgi:hypothetical protein
MIAPLAKNWDGAWFSSQSKDGRPARDRPLHQCQKSGYERALRKNVGDNFIEDGGKVILRIGNVNAELRRVYRGFLV